MGKRRNRKQNKKKHSPGPFCQECGQKLIKVEIGMGIGGKGVACIGKKGCGRWWNDFAWETEEKYRKFKLKVDSTEAKFARMWRDPQKETSMRYFNFKKKMESFIPEFSNGFIGGILGFIEKLKPNRLKSK